jgi:hypothetical protein
MIILQDNTSVVVVFVPTSFLGVKNVREVDGVVILASCGAGRGSAQFGNKRDTFFCRHGEELMFTKRKLSCIYLAGFSGWLGGKGAHRGKPVSRGAKINGNPYLLQDVGEPLRKSYACMMNAICSKFVRF